MKVLVLGGGGREHALAWRLTRDPEVTDVIIAPGNPGPASLGRCVPVDVTDPAAMLGLANREGVDLTVVGPEAILNQGVADVFRAAGRPIVGPTRAGAQLECSKVFSKNFMVRHRIPTAKFVVCESADAALAVIARGEFGLPVVVKADGLAAGKGVVVAETAAEANEAIHAAMVDGLFGAAGSTVVIEECLTGPEVSFFALCDGARALPLGTAQDHKRIFDNDRGPNTGGMGAFAPSPLMTATLADEVMRRVVNLVIDGMHAEGTPYIGFLYVGLMLTPDGPKVIEFNARFGDPEAQVVLPLIEGSFVKLLAAAAAGDLSSVRVKTSDDCTVGVVMASRGYPASAESGREIHGLDRAAAMPASLVFHSGTKAQHGHVVTAGGRVLTVVGRAANYEAAMATAYKSVEQIQFDGMQFRTDIGRKAVAAIGA
jgi:phosphoribosylamine--glycine ligase